MLSMGSVNINGTSKIEETDAVYFSASFSTSSGGNYSITKSVANISLYEANKETCDEDYELFEQKTKEMAEQTIGIF